jgi:maltose phosphorylase
MNKIADEYIERDSWKIIEKGWHPEHSLVSESLFSLGNEYMGVRGYFEEGTVALTLRGSYFNGVYEVEKTAGSSYKGIVQKTHFMVNAVDWLYTKIVIDGEQLCLGNNDKNSVVSEYSRVLDMQTGTLTRTLIWTLHSGKQIRLEFIRFLDMKNPELAYQRITAEPLNFSGTINIVSACDFNAVHKGRNKCYWQEIRNISSEGLSAIIAETVSTKQKIFSGFIWKATNIKSVKPFSQNKMCGIECEFSLCQNEKTVFEKRICNIVDKTNGTSNSDLWKEGVNELETIKTREFSSALHDQKEYWKQVWKSSDIEIDGDEKDQQGIRFCIFQMQQTYHGLTDSDNIGAKGLTGEAYNGHAFWDTETYCLPFYLYSNVKAAKSLLEFRYTTLPQAKKRALMLDCKGACYPVATLNGDEACDLWQHASLQFQPSTGVAYGIAHYVAVTDDTDFLYDHGIEMLIEISRFLLSRGSWNSSKTGFGFYAVMGPDEFHMMVNNNVYTNYMAKKTFEYTLQTLERMKTRNKSAYQKMVLKTKFSEQEEETLRECSKKMILLFNANTKLYEQHEGYFGLPHIDINSIPNSEFPLYDHWSYDRIYRTDMIKQPDVLMFIFLYRNEFPAEVLCKNYEFYEPRTIHESSLSPSVHSILANELGKKEEALKFFGFATRLDLDNYNRNTGDGLHTTSIAAAWVNIVFGFGGMRSEPNMNDVLYLAPQKPDCWKKYIFRIVYKSVPVSVEVTDSSVTIKVCSEKEAAVSVSIYGKKVNVTKEGITVPLQKNFFSK